IHFRGWRVNYEEAAYALGAHLDAPPALWSGPRRRHGTIAIPPGRPPHRVPAGLEELRSATAERRAARSDTGGPAPPTER
ncbi:MAG: hypothetical protein E6I85_15260, partial [Chloroflexi bacterium]